MPSHFCIDPHDPYAQAEVLVEFETTAGGVRLISARDAADDDILSDLEDVQRHALESEILDDYRHDMPSRDGPLHQGPIMDQQEVGRA
ncbi:hypothetical protein [uncultured Methylobacterium sp.]|uniref:hypothetical protein n=1 Tax=uncultured Methylobacterium sp. TaxID=157278 RepID=UPI0035CBE778